MKDINKTEGDGGIPILPGLESRLVEEVMEGLPVIEDLVAVVDDVGGGAHVSEQTQSKRRQQPPHPHPLLLLLLPLVLLRVPIRRR